MVKLRSKLHLSRQGRTSSLSHVFCSAACNAAVPTRPAGTAPLLGSTDELPTLSLPRPTSLGTLPEKLLIRVASFCELSDILRLRRSSRALYFIFGQSRVLERVLIHLVSFLFFFPDLFLVLPRRLIRRLTSSTLHVRPPETLGQPGSSIHIEFGMDPAAG